jgi:ribosomal protein L37E
MARIPGWLFLIVGLGVVIYSSIIQSSAQADVSLQLFYYIGIIFICWGIIKMIFRAAKDHREKSPLKKVEMMRKAHILQQRHQKPHVPAGTFCPRCGRRQPDSHGRFCRVCGYRIR